MSIINANSGGIYFTADSSGNVAISSNGVVGVTVPNNGGIIIASWTTSTRPTSPSTGQVGFNTTLDILEQYDGSSWIGLGAVLSVPEYNFIVNTGSPNITSSSCNNVVIGQNAGCGLTTGDFNNFLGQSAGACNTTGSNNNFFGRSAGQSNTIGSNNIFMGQQAGFCNTTGLYNKFFGFCSGFNNLTGCYNIFMGYLSGFFNTSGEKNLFIGRLAGLANTTGSSNNFIGNNSGRENTIGNYNTFIGDQSGSSNTSGSFNLFLGRLAGLSNTTGSNNNYLGNNSGRCTTIGSCNNFFGCGAGFSNAVGSCNNFFGCGAGYSNNGNNNNFFGFKAGFCNTTGTNNLFFGCYAGVGSVGLANITTESNRIIMGNSDHTCAQIQIAWTAVSDCRDKHIYCRLDKGRSFLGNIKPIVFSFKNRETNEITDIKKRYGFSAQEILSLEGDEPILVGVDNPEKLGLTTDYLIPILVNAVNELSNEVETLRPLLQEVAMLKQQIEKLVK